MSLNVNVVHLAGNLTRDPQVRFLSGDKAVADFGLAVNRRWKSNDGQQKEEVTFVDVVAWGRTAELVGQYLSKGRGAYVIGRLTLEAWDDKETGQKRSKLKVVAESVQFTDSKQDRSEPTGDEPAPVPQRPAQPTGGSYSESNDPPPFARSELEYGL